MLTDRDHVLNSDFVNESLNPLSDFLSISLTPNRKARREKDGAKRISTRFREDAVLADLHESSAQRPPPQLNRAVTIRPAQLSHFALKGHHLPRQQKDPDERTDG